MEKFATERFIHEIECRPALWDNSSTEYNDRDAKKECWDDLVDIFGGDIQSASKRREMTFTLQRRWKNIRSSYTRELKRQRGLMGPERKCEYKFFKFLDFLQPVVNTKDSADSGVQEDSESNEDNDHEPKPKKSKTEKKQSITDELNINYYPPEELTVRPEIEHPLENEVCDRLFFLSLVSTFKDIPEQKRLSTKIKILTVLNEALEESYQKES